MTCKVCYIFSCTIYENHYFCSLFLKININIYLIQWLFETNHLEVSPLNYVNDNHHEAYLLKMILLLNLFWTKVFY